MVETVNQLSNHREGQSTAGWDDGVRHGWFVGRVVRSGVTPGDLRQVPTANFVVRYAAKQTGGELNGLVACELSPRTHGVDQWWVLLR